MIVMMIDDKGYTSIHTMHTKGQVKEFLENCPEYDIITELDVPIKFKREDRCQIMFIKGKVVQPNVNLDTAFKDREGL